MAHQYSSIFLSFRQGAYESFFAYLNNDPMCQVVGIPLDQLKIASLGRAHLEKGYPSAKKLIAAGVPRGLAMALAPFQRGGVDFVVEKGGRALVADGKNADSFCAKILRPHPNTKCCFRFNLVQRWDLERYVAKKRGF